MDEEEDHGGRRGEVCLLLTVLRACRLYCSDGTTRACSDGFSLELDCGSCNEIYWDTTIPVITHRPACEQRTNTHARTRARTQAGRQA